MSCNETAYMERADVETKYKSQSKENTRAELTALVFRLSEWPSRPLENNPRVKQPALLVCLEGDLVIPFFEERPPWGYSQEEWLKAKAILAREAAT